MLQSKHISSPMNAQGGNSMFGQAPDQNGDQNQPIDDNQQPAPADDQAQPSDPGMAAAATDLGGGQDTAADWQHPGAPLDDASSSPSSEPAPISDVISPAGGFPKPPSLPPTNSFGSASGPIDSPPPPPPPAPTDDAGSSDLNDIKQHALQELAPLVDDLQQPPEERFRTIMMMIQASDDQALIPKAYEAAHSIEDETARAQALLDVVNEINYFTHPQDDQQN